jgi:hypothetical protein
MDKRATTERTPACNSTYKKLAVQWLNETLCFVTSSVVGDSFVLRNRQLLVAANRQAVKKPNSNLFLQKNTPTIFLDFTSACLP